MKTSGFVVVSSNLEYRGIDREPWSFLHQEHYAGRLNREFEGIRRNIYENGFDLTGIEVAQDIDTACKVLNWMRSFNHTGEIIALSSSTLEDRKGLFPCGKMNFLGFDVFSFGDWSLIKAGLIDSNAMCHWRSILNGNMLFEDERHIPSFIEEYCDFVTSGRLEPLSGGADFPVEPVEVREPF